MKLTDPFLKLLCWMLILSAVYPSAPVRAEGPGTAPQAFTLDLGEGWIELPLPLQGIVASYGKKGTLATFYVTERELDEAKKVEQLEWRDLFSPRFDDIEVRMEGTSVIGGKKARYCIYGLKPGDFKRTMEGKLPAKYINYVVIHDKKLFSITFKDTEEGFALTYPSFLAVMRTFRFHDPVPAAAEKKP